MSYGYRATLRKMEIGDSLFFPTETPDKVRSTLTGSISQLKHESNFKFASRRVDGGLRLWRIE